MENKCCTSSELIKSVKMAAHNNLEEFCRATTKTDKEEQYNILQTRISWLYDFMEVVNEDD